ncbi:hypothetical protein AAG570_005122 [Ranatra chinensis]|uniref:MRH domain-containing protein n=1 Tax=Ranatra chinensis TaxID=642074 RepID=A0ABD0Y214_9HEMI
MTAAILHGILCRQSLNSTGNEIISYTTYVQISLVGYGHCDTGSGCTLVGPSAKDTKKLALFNGLAPLKGSKFSVVSGGSSYNISICGDVDKNKSANASATVTRTSGNTTATTVIGRYNATDISGDDTGDWVLLVYSDGDAIKEGFCNGSSWRTMIFIKCTTKNDVKLELLDESAVGCFAMFRLKTSAVCPYPEVPPGLSKGAVILVLLLTALICYMLVGVAYRRLVAGAKGLEQIPNYQFWKQVLAWPCERIRGLSGRGVRNEDRWRPSETADEPLLSP